MPMTIDNFIPKYIKQTINDRPKQVVDKNYWNNLWNLIIQQGDWNSEAVTLLCSELGITKEALATLQAIVTAHNSNTANPHNVTTEQVGTYTKAVIDSKDAALQTQITNNFNTLQNNITTGDNNLQLQVNQNAAKAVDLQNQINNLDNIYSTDAERISAIAQIVADYQLSDNQITQLITDKANRSEVYTKSQIDQMTLGAYKFGEFRHSLTLAQATNKVDIPITEYLGDNDVLMVFIGGVFAAKGLQYNIVAGTAYNYAIQSLEGTWDIDTDIDFIVFKNTKVIAPQDYLDGSMLQPKTVGKDKLTQSLQDEINAKTTQTALDTYKTDVANKTDDTKGATMVGLKPIAGLTGDNVRTAIQNLFQFANDGKTGIANAVTAKGVAASPSDTFAALATKIGQISTGKKWASGTVTGQSNGSLVINSLDFRPKIVLVHQNWYGNIRTVVAYSEYPAGTTSNYLQQTSGVVVTPASNGFTASLGTYWGSSDLNYEVRWYVSE